MESIHPSLVNTLLILLAVLVLSEGFYRVFGIMIGDMQDKSARPRFRRTAFTLCVVIGFATIWMVRRDWFDLISTPLALAGSWGLIRLFSLLTDRFGD